MKISSSEFANACGIKGSYNSRAAQMKKILYKQYSIDVGPPHDPSGHHIDRGNDLAPYNVVATERALGALIFESGDHERACEAEVVGLDGVKLISHPDGIMTGAVFEGKAPEKQPIAPAWRYIAQMQGQMHLCLQKSCVFSTYTEKIPGSREGYEQQIWRMEICHEYWEWMLDRLGIFKQHVDDAVEYFSNQFDSSILVVPEEITKFEPRRLTTVPCAVKCVKIWNNGPVEEPVDWEEIERLEKEEAKNKRLARKSNDNSHGSGPSPNNSEASTGPDGGQLAEDGELADSHGAVF
jgi:hypothetical protein